MGHKLFENMCYMLWDMANSSPSDAKAFFSGTTHPGAMEYFSFVLSMLTCIIGYAGNIIVIFVTGFLMKKNKYKIWFLNLAVADLVFLLFLPLHSASELKGRWSYGSAVCKFYNFISSVNMNASIYILAALNIDRALSVAKPIWHLRFRSRRFCCCMCAIIWVSSILCSVPAIMYSRVHVMGEESECTMFIIDFNTSKQLSNNDNFDFENDILWDTWVALVPREMCKTLFYISEIPEMEKYVALWSEELVRMLNLVVPLAVFGYLIPLCVILFSSVIIALHVKNSRMVASSRLYRVVIIEVLSFFCTRTPYVLAHIIVLISGYTMHLSLIYKVSVSLPLLISIFAINSCLNPVVYVLVGEQVRSEIVTFFTKKL